jgi:putative spermidine/putrescine transport system permease protein
MIPEKKMILENFVVIQKNKKKKMKPWNVVLSIFSILVVLFLFLPIVIVIPMSFSSANSLQFPPPGFSLRWYESFFGNPAWLEATKTSFIVSIVASLIALFLGGMAAYGLAIGNFRGKNFILGNVIAPMIIPTIITGVALYMAFAQLEILGTLPGLILAHTLLIVPYIVLITLPSFEAFDKRIELAARSLGANWITVARRIIIPIILPSVLAAWLFAFIISFDELIVTIFLSGTYVTLPKKMFNELVLQINPTITAISTLLIVLTSIFMVIVAFVMNRASKRGTNIKIGD